MGYNFCDFLDEQWGGKPVDYPLIEQNAMQIFADKEKGYENASDIAIWMVGRGDKQGVAHGIRLLKYLSLQGLASAMFNLAIEKIKGQCLNRDFVGANTLLERVIAEEKQDIALVGEAMNVLADSYRIGRGRKINLAAALDLYMQAADRGVAEAAFNAGLFFHGKIPSAGIQYQPSKAAHYYEIAADMGNIPARTNLGLLHACEVFPTAVKAHGLKLLRMSVADGDAYAQDALDRIAALEEQHHAASSKTVHEDSMQQHSTIAPGTYPPGALLPMEHPDQIKIMSALFHGDPNAHTEPPKRMCDLSPAEREEMFKNAEKKLEFNDFSGEKFEDQMTSSFLMNTISMLRAAGFIPDDSFNEMLAEICSPEGRRRMVEVLSENFTQPLY